LRDLIKNLGLLNYTAKIDADKTAGEITKCLSMHGASWIMTDYEDGVLSAISFGITLNDRKMGFRLPCDWRGLRDADQREETCPMGDRRSQSGALGERTSNAGGPHRVAHCEGLGRGKMALVETQMVTTRDVFLPYAVMRDGRTLSQYVQSDPGFLLGPGAGE
jgi:hypothetical protein